MSGTKPKSKAAVSADFASVFGRLREILAKHSGGLSVSADSPGRYCLEGKVGPATLRAWGGKAKRATIPVAWAEVGKSYVSYHLMPAYGDPGLHERMSDTLKARMQGKSCFNFTGSDEPLFKELEQLTARAILDFQRAGYVV